MGPARDGKRVKELHGAKASGKILSQQEIRLIVEKLGILIRPHELAFHILMGMKGRSPVARPHHRFRVEQLEGFPGKKGCTLLISARKSATVFLHAASQAS